MSKINKQPTAAKGAAPAVKADEPTTQLDSTEDSSIVDEGLHATGDTTGDAAQQSEEQSSSAQEDSAGETEDAASAVQEDDGYVDVVVPRTFGLTTSVEKTHWFEAGNRRMLKEHFDHWYTQAHGVTLVPRNELK